MNIINTILPIILPMLLGGIIGLSTNWIAIKMLFRPHHPKYIFGKRLPFTPGLIPKERSRLAKSMADAVSTRLLNPEVLVAGLMNEDLWQIPDITIAEALSAMGIEDFKDVHEPIGNRLKDLADFALPRAGEFIDNMHENYPVLDEKLLMLTHKIVDDSVNKFAALFISKDRVYASIKEGLKEYLTETEDGEALRDKVHAAIDDFLSSEMTETMLRDKILTINIRDLLAGFLEREKATVNRVLGMVAKYLANNLPIAQLIEKQVNGFDVAEVENTVLSVAGKELKLIIWLGGLLGFIMGILVAFL